MSISPDRRLIILALVGWGATTLALAIPSTRLLVAAAAFIALALVVWDWKLLQERPRVKTERLVPDRAFIGRETKIRVLVHNQRSEPIEVSLLEELPRDVTDEDPYFEKVEIDAHGRSELGYSVHPTFRGDRELGPTIVFESSPMGFLRRRTITPAQDPLAVYPDIKPLLSAEALNPRKVLAALGMKPVRRRGEGAEFDTLREYVPGDDPRRIDWAASARRGRPITRVFQHEHNHRVIVAIDASRLMAGMFQGRSKLDHAIDASLVLAYAALSAGDRMSVLAFDETPRSFIGPFNHRNDLGRILAEVRSLQPKPVEADYTALVRELQVRERQHALVVVITDFVESDPETSRALALLARRHRVLVVALRDSIFKELDVPENPDGSASMRSRSNPMDLENGVADEPLRRLVLGDLLHEREALLGGLRARGVQTLDLLPGEIIAPILNRYLAIRYGDGG